MIVIVGAVYYAAVQHRKPSHLQAPEGEAMADEALAAAPATST